MISEQLKTYIEQYAARARRFPLFELARRGEVSPELATTYLSNTRYLVSHTPRHLQLARRRSLELGQPELAAHFAHKLGEETGHDLWAEADVIMMRDLFGARPQDAPARALVEQMVYLESAIADDPVRYLAYAFYVEYFTVLCGPEWVEVLEQKCGVPRHALTVVTHHVELDQQHVADGVREIDVLVTDPALLPKMLDTLQRAMRYFERFCDEIHALSGMDQRAAS